MQNDMLKIQENWYWARKVMIILLQGIFSKFETFASLTNKVKDIPR